MVIVVSHFGAGHRVVTTAVHRQGGIRGQRRVRPWRQRELKGATASSDGEEAAGTGVDPRTDGLAAKGEANAVRHKPEVEGSKTEQRAPGEEVAAKLVRDAVSECFPLGAGGA